MKKETYICDTCEAEHDLSKKGIELQVIFTTEQNEGKTVGSYLQREKLDLCGVCFERVLTGEAVWATGAMGYNQYFFKKNLNN